MRRLSALAILLLLTPSAWAEDVAVIVDSTKPGTFLLTVAADGSVAVSPLRIVRVGVPPGNPPPVDPVPVTPLLTKVEALTNGALITGGTKTSGAAIASVYSLAGKEVAEDRLDPLKAFDFTASATETILGFQADKPKWDAFRKELALLLTPIRDAGGLMTKEQVASVMKQIAAGMDKATGFNSSPGSLRAVVDSTPADRERMGIFDGIDIAQIIELIKLILTLLSLFKGGM